MSQELHIMSPQLSHDVPAFGSVKKAVLML